MRDAIETALQARASTDSAADTDSNERAFKSAYVRIPITKADVPIWTLAYWARDVHAAKHDAEASRSTAGVVLPAADTRFTKAERKAIPKATVAAAALAAHGADGVYVLDLAPDQWWMCGVRGGQVIPGTDVCDSPDILLPGVQRLAQLDLPVFAPDTLASDARLHDCRTADVVRLVAKPGRTLRAKAYRPATIPVIVAACIVALIVIIGFGVHVHDQHKAALAVQQSRQAQLHAYVQSVRQAVGAYPRSATWALSAMDAMRAALPPVLGGFEIETVTCKPSACVATYKVATHYGYLVAPFRTAFPDAKIVQQHDGSTLAITLPLHTATVPVTLAWLRTRHASNARLIDWIGTVPAMAPGAHVSGQPLRRALPAPPVQGAHLPALSLEQTKVQSPLHLAPGALATFVQRASYGGFMPTQLTWSPMEFGWTLLWERIHAR
ncbi:MAG TPA: hypothetical protein VF292_08510 [Rhodanobacteraceae bacterium]